MLRCTRYFERVFDCDSTCFVFHFICGTRFRFWCDCFALCSTLFVGHKLTSDAIHLISHSLRCIFLSCLACVLLQVAHVVMLDVYHISLVISDSLCLMMAYAKYFGLLCLRLLAHCGFAIRSILSPVSFYFSCTLSLSRIIL